MLVFPPPFKRKCHPRCAKQILDFTFLLQIVKGGPREIPGLVWWLVFWMDPCTRGAGRIIHTYLNFPKFHPTSINLDAFIPFYCEQGKLAPPCGGQTPSRGAPTDCSPRAPFLRGGWFQIQPFPTFLREVISSCPFGPSCPVLRRGFSHFWKRSATTEEKTKKSDVSPDRWIWCVWIISGLPAPEEL